MKDLGMMHYFLGRSMEISGRDFPKPRKICSRNPKDIRNDRLQGYDYSNDNKFEATE